MAAYKRMDMSISYPMMRSLPIIFTICITSALHLGQSLSALAIAGMLIAFVGCLLMPLKDFSEFSIGKYLNRNIFLISLVALGTTGYTIFDKQAQALMTAHSSSEISPVMLSVTFYSTRVIFQNVMGWTVGMSIPSCRREFLPTLKAHAASVFCAGSCSSLTYILVLIAMHFVTNVSFVQVFRQMGLVFGVAAGILILKEKPTKPKLLGVTLIVIGLVLTVLPKLLNPEAQ